jgi:hypothetical protein
MHSYRCYFLDSSASVIFTAVLIAANDDDAWLQAEAIAECQPDQVKAWTLFEGDRCVVPRANLHRRDPGGDEAAPPLPEMDES